MPVMDKHNLPAYFLAWPSHGALPAFLATEALKVIWVNSALSAFDRTAPVRVQDGGLVFADRARQVEFAAFIAQVGDTPSAWVLEKENGEFLLFRCEWLRPHGQQPAVGCVIHDSHARTPFVWADFGRVFGLTAAEAVLARRLADGELLVQVAANLGITQETAKTHLRRVYAKLGVGSREEFYAKLLPFRVV
jgi:DNA-binding CsgD family transcriptional regulator